VFQTPTTGSRQTLCVSVTNQFLRQKMTIDIDKYLKDHLPYSIEIMFSHEAYKTKYHEKAIDDNQILRGVFVGSITKGRMLLEVLGIKLHADGEVQDAPKVTKDKVGEDGNNIAVYADDLRGKLVVVADLKRDFPNEMQDIKHYLIAANKYELHLTKQRYDRDLEKYDKALPFILKLVDEYIYLNCPDNKLIREDLIKTNRVFGEIFKPKLDETPHA
jgi:hypothetical protein